MKKNKTEGKCGFCHTVSLFRDDLDDIINIISEVSDHAKISDDNYEYDSLDELLKERGSKPKILSISSNLYDVYINFKPSSVFVSCSGRDRDTIYAYDRITEILRKRRSILSRIFNPVVGIIFFCILLLLSLFLDDLPYINVDNIHKWFPEWYTQLVFILSLSAVPVFALFLRIGASSSIVLLRRHEQKNFFARQKDDLIKLTIACAAGAFLTELVRRLFD